MSKYTIELRTVCDLYGRDTVESWFKDYDMSYYLRPDEIASIEEAGLFSKDRLAQKIVDHSIEELKQVEVQVIMLLDLVYQVIHLKDKFKNLLYLLERMLLLLEQVKQNHLVKIQIVLKKNILNM